jgi:hypothetical protein
MEAATVARVLDFFNVSALVIPHLFLRVAQNGVCLSNIFKHLVSIETLFFLSARVLVRMPLQGSTFVSFLDLILCGIFAHLQDLVVVLAL